MSSSDIDPTTALFGLPQQAAVPDADGAAAFHLLHNAHRPSGRTIPKEHDIARHEAAALYHAIDAHALSLPIGHMAIVAEGPHAPVPDLGDFRLTPVLPPIPAYLNPTLNRPSENWGVHLRPGVSVEYRRPGGQPVMDARLGIGLVFQDRLVAVCAGGLSTHGAIITQLQDVSNKKPPHNATKAELRKFPYCNPTPNGLRDGILWKETLTRAWCTVLGRALVESVPSAMNMPFIMQSARNNTWTQTAILDKQRKIIGYGPVDAKLLKRYEKKYDNTAKHFGGERQQDGNFIMRSLGRVGVQEWRVGA